MNPTFTAQLLFPVALLIIQTYILLFGTLYLMRRMRIITTAIADMEISHVIVAGAFMFGVFLISTADYAPLLQTFKIYSTNNDAVYSATFYRFGQFFLDVFAAEVMFVLLTWLNVKIFLGGK